MSREIYQGNAKKIYLNNNEILDIEPGGFVHNTNCTNLRLSYNKITEVKKHMWTGLVALEYLSLEHNDIEYIEPSAFADLPNLKGLYLHNNKLTTLPENIFPLKQMPTIEILTLHDNNLKHNELGWLHELCNSGEIQEYTIRGDDIPCTSPSKATKHLQQQIQPKVSAYRSDMASLEQNTQGEKNHERFDITSTTTQLAQTRQRQHYILHTSVSTISAGKIKDNSVCDPPLFTNDLFTPSENEKDQRTTKEHQRLNGIHQRNISLLHSLSLGVHVPL